MIRQMMAEDEWQQQAGSQYHSSLYTEENKEKDLPMDEAGKPDFADIDGDGDKKETMKQAVLIGSVIVIALGLFVFLMVSVAKAMGL